jgi:hypothetical protein
MVEVMLRIIEDGEKSPECTATAACVHGFSANTSEGFTE